MNSTFIELPWSLWRVPWRDIPACYGPWSTLARFFYRWQQQGILQRIVDTLQTHADAAGTLDWEVHYVDGTVIRAHQHAAGAAGSTPESEALGQSQGGFSSKVHVRAEGQEKPMTFVLTAGQRHEVTAFERLMEQGAVKRVGRGRPKVRPTRVVGDKGYSPKVIRRMVCIDRWARWSCTYVKIRLIIHLNDELNSRAGKRLAFAGSATVSVRGVTLYPPYSRSYRYYSAIR